MNSAALLVRVFVVFKIEFTKKRKNIPSLRSSMPVCTNRCAIAQNNSFYEAAGCFLFAYDRIEFLGGFPKGMC